MKKHDYDALQSLLTQAMNRDIARLGAIREQIDGVAAAKSRLKSAAHTEFPAAGSIAELQSYGAWTGWSIGRQKRYDAERHALEDQAASARQDLTRSFGKTEAVKELGKEAEKEELRDHRRRAEQNGTIPDR